MGSYEQPKSGALDRLPGRRASERYCLWLHVQVNELHERWRSELQQAGGKTASERVDSATTSARSDSSDLLARIRADLAGSTGSDNLQLSTSALRRFASENATAAAAARHFDADDPLAQWASPDTEQLRPVLQSTLRLLIRSLAGPRSSRSCSVRLWTFIGTGHGFLGCDATDLYAFLLTSPSSFILLHFASLFPSLFFIPSQSPFHSVQPFILLPAFSVTSVLTLVEHCLFSGYGAFVFLQNLRDDSFCYATYSSVPIWGGIGKSWNIRK